MYSIIAKEIAKGPREAISGFETFLSKLTGRIVLSEQSKLRIDDFIYGSYEFSKLICQEFKLHIYDNNLGLYLYSDRVWCGGCSSNCNLDKNELMFFKTSSTRAEEIRKNLEDVKMRWNNVGKGLLLTLGSPAQAEITTYNWKDERSVRLLAAEDWKTYSTQTKVPYKEALDLINKFRRLRTI